MSQQQISTEQAINAVERFFNGARCTDLTMGEVMAAYQGYLKLAQLARQHEQQQAEHEQPDDEGE